MNRSRATHQRVSFERVEGSQLTDAEIDSLAMLIAKAMYRTLGTKRSVQVQGDHRRDTTETSDYA